MSGLLSIGRFAGLSQVSIKTLRRYDARGLLRPAYVDSRTGYRYYRLAQLRDAQIIGLLRWLEMPLDEVRAILGEPDTAKAKSLLKRHGDRIRERLAAGQRALAFIERLLEEAFPMQYDVQLKEVPPLRVIGLRFRSPAGSLGHDIAAAIQRVECIMREQGLNPVGPPVLVSSHAHTHDGVVFDAHVCLLVEPSPESIERLPAETLPGGRFAFTTHVGPYEELGAAYEAVGAWVVEHGYSIAGPLRQTMLTERGTTDPACFRTEVAFPIQ